MIKKTYNRILDHLTYDAKPTGLIAAELSYSFNTVERYLAVIEGDGLAIKSKPANKNLWSKAMTNIKSENKRPCVMGKTDRPKGKEKIPFRVYPVPKTAKGGGSNICVSFMRWDSKRFLLTLP